MKENPELVKRALTMFCVECGKRDHEYVLLNKKEAVVSGKTIMIPNVPSIRCKNCGALAYTPYAMEYIESYKASMDN